LPLPRQRIDRRGKADRSPKHHKQSEQARQHAQPRCS
jgi:hypothetical protein